MLVTPLVEEGTDFEVFEHSDYNEEGYKRIRLYSWESIGKAYNGAKSEYDYTDRDECEADAIKTLTDLIEAETYED
jgi:hypothetical protein